MSAEPPISNDSGELGLSPGSKTSEEPGSTVESAPALILFGDYELLEEIARGGMGVVYKARQRALNRLVALKMILAGKLASEAEVQRFKNEAEAAASLDHPNIVPIYQVGALEGRYFYSMRLVNGGNLAQWSAQFRVQTAGWVRDSAALMMKVAGAVHHAHQRGVLHRDLKPSNILMDENGLPHVTDFGLAKSVAQDSDLTLSGSTLGTPDYMAPEQARGNAKYVTMAADVFSLGAICYELLTGEPPFHGATPLETLKRTVDVEPRRPRSLNREVDHDLETICLKCLEKEPQRRYGTARDFADDLEHWLAREPIRARPISRPERVVKWIRRRPAIAAIIGLSLVGLAGFSVQTIEDQRTLRAERDMAEVRQAEALLGEGDALAASDRLAEAKDRILRAWDIWDKKQTTTLPAELSLMQVYRFSPPPLLTLTGHAGKVTCVAVSPDQRSILSGGRDGTIRVWSCPLGVQTAAWNAHSNGVACLAISSDGRIWVSGGADKMIKIWDARNSALLKVIKGHTGQVSAVSFSPKGNLLASASWDRTIRVWSLSTGQQVQVLRVEPDEVSAIAFSTGGRRILAGTENHGVAIWNLDDPSHPARYDTDKSCPSVVYSPDGKEFLRGDARGALVGRDSENGQPIYANDSMRPAVSAMAFLPGGCAALSGESDGTINAWNLASDQKYPEVMLSEHEGAVSGIATFSDSRLAASASDDGTVRIWNLLPDQGVPNLQGHGFFVSGAVFSPDGRLILSASWDGLLKLWDVATGRVLMDYAGHAGIVFEGAFSPGGRQIASAGEDGTVRIWDVTNGEKAQVILAVKNALRTVAWSPDGKLILAGEGPGRTHQGAQEEAEPELFKVHVMDAVTKRELHGFVAHRGGLFALAFSKDGQTVLSGGGDGRMKLWDARSWQETRSFDADKLRVNSVAFAPDSRHCVSAGASRMLRVWELATGQETRSFGTLKDEPACTAISPDGSLLLVGMEHGNMTLWQLTTGTEIHSFSSANKGGVFGVGFAPTGRMAVCGGVDASVRVWDLDRSSEWRSTAAAAQMARAVLQSKPHDCTALLTMAKWYEFRGMWNWAAEVFEEARAQGAKVSYLSLARCHWQDGELEEAGEEMNQAAQRGEAPHSYLELCHQAIARQIAARSQVIQAQSPEGWDRAGVSGQTHVLQPGPETGKDIWTTSYYSCAEGGETPGGGQNDYRLRVGGFGDDYYSLLEFDLHGCPAKAVSATLWLYCFGIRGGGIPMYLDRITQAWDWRTSGTGRDHERLWWADKPLASQWRAWPLKAPLQGQWYEVDITDLYNSWESGVYPNYGLQLRDVQHANEKFNEFYSADYLHDPSLRPKLVIRATGVSGSKDEVRASRAGTQR